MMEAEEIRLKKKLQREEEREESEGGKEESKAATLDMFRCRGIAGAGSRDAERRTKQAADKGIEEKRAM